MSPFYDPTDASMSLDAFMAHLDREILKVVDAQIRDDIEGTIEAEYTIIAEERHAPEPQLHALPSAPEHT